VTYTPTGVYWAEAVQPVEAQRQARVAASLAEYLAEYVHGDPDRALEGTASLVEGCDGDLELFARARADVVRDMCEQHQSTAENDQDAVARMELASGVQ